MEVKDARGDLKGFGKEAEVAGRGGWERGKNQAGCRKKQAQEAGTRSDAVPSVTVGTIGWWRLGPHYVWDRKLTV